MSTIPRHKTALSRTRLSRPMRLTLEDGLLTEGGNVLDYGCGKGGDLQRLRRRGFKVEGWDPVHRPRGQRRAADVVNLGYVVNVIENPHERAETLRSAWSYAERLLVVSARLVLRCEPSGGACCTLVGIERGAFCLTEAYQRTVPAARARSGNGTENEGREGELAEVR